jgi:hypothetical protein
MFYLLWNQGNKDRESVLHKNRESAHNSTQKHPFKEQAWTSDGNCFYFLSKQ